MKIELRGNIDAMSKTNELTVRVAVQLTNAAVANRPIGKEAVAEMVLTISPLVAQQLKLDQTLYVEVRTSESEELS